MALGPTEYRMLAFFMTHPERVYTREQLLDRVWGGNVYVEERTIDVHIRRLRKALEEIRLRPADPDGARFGLPFSARNLSSEMNSGTTAFVYVAACASPRDAGAGRGGRLVRRLRVAGISGALALYLAWNLWQLRALALLAAAPQRRRSAAMPWGLWGDVVAQVVRLHRRKRFHKERLTRLFRELRRSTAAMPDGVVMLDPQGEIVWFNRKAGELLDLSRRADLGLRIDNLVRHPDFVRYLRGGQYSIALVMCASTRRPNAHIAFQLISYGEDQRLLMLRDVTREVRSSRCARISSPTPRTSCARRSPWSRAISRPSAAGSGPGRARRRRSPRCAARPIA